MAVFFDTPEARRIPWSPPYPGAASSRPQGPRFTVAMNSVGYWVVHDRDGQFPHLRNAVYRLYRGAELKRKAMELYVAGDIAEAGKHSDWAFMSDKGMGFS